MEGVNRRSLLGRIAAFAAAPLAFFIGRKAYPISADFKNDAGMACWIHHTHERVRLSDGKPVVAMDGNPHYFYADEGSGCHGAFKLRDPSVPRSYYTVFPETNRSAQRVARTPETPRGAETASWMYYSPFRFVPRKGMEKEAAACRVVYAAREAGGLGGKHLRLMLDNGVSEQRAKRIMLSWSGRGRRHNIDRVSRAYGVPRESLRS